MQLTPTQQRVYNHIRYEVKHGNHRLYHAGIADACNLSKSHARHIVYQLRDMGVITISYPFEVNSRDREAPIYRLSRGRVVPFFGKSKRHPSRSNLSSNTGVANQDAPNDTRGAACRAPRYIPNRISSILEYTDAIVQRVERYARTRWNDLTLIKLEKELDKYQNYVKAHSRVRFLHACVRRLRRMVQAKRQEVYA